LAIYEVGISLSTLRHSTSRRRRMMVTAVWRSKHLRWENISHFRTFRQPPTGGQLSRPSGNASRGLPDFSWSTHFITVFRCDSVLAKISTLPPLVTPSEVVRCFSQLTSDANTLQFSDRTVVISTGSGSTKRSFPPSRRRLCREFRYVSPYSECITFLTRCDGKTYLRKSD
jgi:hypothetical protein